MMNKTDKTDDKGRTSTYLVDTDTGLSIPIGPPPGLVDFLPEPFATRLHNVLHARGILNYDDIIKTPNALQGALQEALSVDTQTLSQKFWEYQGNK